MNRRKNGWLNGWMGRWIDEWAGDQWMDGWMGLRSKYGGSMVGRMARQLERWLEMDG